MKQKKDAHGVLFKMGVGSDEPLEAAQFAFDLRAPQRLHLFLDRRIVLEDAGALAAALTDRKDRFGFLVFVIVDNAGDGVDRARAFLQDVPALTIDLHAGEHVVRPRHRRKRRGACTDWSSFRP